VDLDVFLSPKDGQNIVDSQNGRDCFDCQCDGAECDKQRLHNVLGQHIADSTLQRKKEKEENIVSQRSDEELIGLSCPLVCATELALAFATHVDRRAGAANAAANSRMRCSRLWRDVRNSGDNRTATAATATRQRDDMRRSKALVDVAKICQCE
jgi:hypothetical protein